MIFILEPQVQINDHMIKNIHLFTFSALCIHFVHIKLVINLNFGLKNKNDHRSIPLTLEKPFKQNEEKNDPYSKYEKLSIDTWIKNLTGAIYVQIL